MRTQLGLCTERGCGAVSGMLARGDIHCCNENRISTM